MATKLMLDMLKKIARNELTCVNGAEPENIRETETWADCIIETDQDKGVFTSLLNANLATHGGKGRDAVVALTEEGLAVYRSNFKEGENE